ncbi:MAG: PfkB family carbohydrate kinase [Proteobacteria bacterium]|jgi:D-beta-D-heptose 7-phosphate kinase/D-beta-D-heptose 1-phosphate adenosyltransferase|nr:PfkB family carbohydrate kinase [Pseudomonadota bacterium]
MEALKTLIRRVNKYRPTIVVIGDCLLDEYYNVVADKLSPEFPIVRMLGTNERPDVVVPGGAGNLANQFKYFNTDVKLFGFLDIESRPLYQSIGVDISGCETLSSPSFIPRKRRFYQDNFPLSRWDIEVPNYGLQDIVEYQKDLLAAYDEVSDVAVTIYADYNKGVLSGANKTQWFKKERDTISIIDPKKGPLCLWNGCTIFKPNAKEAEELSHIPSVHWQNQCDFFQRQLGCMAVVITHGGDGVYGKVMEKYFDYHSPYSSDCASVIGAGDCFISVLGLAMAHALDIVDAVQIAYEAGAVYVGKKYNEPICLQEVYARIDPVGSKMIDIQCLNNRPYKLAVTNGCFDILHFGHMEILKFAKSKGDKLLVLVDTDEQVKRFKGEGRPVNDLQARMRMLAALECVDFVMPFNSNDELHDIYAQIKPDVLVKDNTWPYIVGSDVAKEVVVFPRVEGYATTNIVEKIKKST